MISDTIRQRYLQDPLPNRLGVIAADLARIASFSENPKNHHAVSTPLEENKYFAEWAAREAPLRIQGVLSKLQIQVAFWEIQRRKTNPALFKAANVQYWSDQILELSGLSAH